MKTFIIHAILKSRRTKAHGQKAREATDPKPQAAATGAAAAAAAGGGYPPALSVAGSLPRVRGVTLCTSSLFACLTAGQGLFARAHKGSQQTPCEPEGSHGLPAINSLFWYT